MSSDRSASGDGEDGVGVDPAPPASAVADGPWPAGLRAGRSSTWSSDALLDARDAADLRRVAVAADRVGDVADRRHDRLDEAAPAGRASCRSNAAGVVVDEVLDDAAWASATAASQASGSSRTTSSGSLPSGSRDDAHVLELTPDVSPLELADERRQRGHPERARPSRPAASTS